MSEQVLPPATIQEDPKARAKADKAYAKAMRPWYKKKRFIIPLLLVIIFAVSQATKGGSTPETTSTGANDTAQVGSSGQGDAGAPAAGAAKIGQKVRDGKFEFVVTKVQQGVKSVGDKYLGQKAQGQYVLIHITVTNIGDESQMLADSSQKVRDAKGREFSADTAAAIYLEDNKVFINEINPGNTVKGTLVYDMPKDTKPTSIELHDSPFSEGVMVKFG
jgi:hypothetical protein